MASQRFAFPVPERALPRIRVSPEQHEELRAFAVRTAHDVLRDGPTWGRSNVQAARERGWKVSQKSPDMCFMMKTQTTSKPLRPRTRPASTGGINTTALSTSNSVSSDESPLHGTHSGGGGGGGRAFMGAVRLAGYNLDDVIASIHCEATSAQRTQVAKSYGHAYLDCSILQTLEGAKPFDPFWYLGLKWTALRSPVDKLVNHREFVYLEHSGTHVNAQGQRMLYRIIQSISLEEFGGEPAYFGLTRAHLEAAYVYWMDAPLHHLPAADGVADTSGVLTVCMKGMAHPKGKVPLWLIERYMKKFWKAGWSLKGSDGAAVSDLAHDDSNPLTLDLATQWVADADRKACALCQKKFRFGRRMRHHCRACGEVICRSCTQYFLLTYPTSSSVGSAYDGMTKSARQNKNPFGDDDDMPATLGGDNFAPRRGRMRVASENDAVMIGKVCRRCIEMKKVAIRRETSRGSSSKRNRSSRGMTGHSWEHNGGAGGLKPMAIQEHEELELPIMGHEDEEADYFIPETPGPQANNNQYYHQQPQYNNNQHHRDDHDDAASEFSIGDFESSHAFKPYATLDLKAHRTIDEVRPSVESKFSQSGFSVGIRTHEDDSDDDDGIVDYHSDPEHDQPNNGAVRHPHVGHLAHLTVEEEERFTSTQQRRPPPPVAQNFVLTAAALHSQRENQDARLRLEDLLADTDDEGEQDYSTSPPLRPSALEIQELRPQPHLIRTTSAPPLTMQRGRMAPPPPPPPRRAESAELDEASLATLNVGRFHIEPNRDHNRESNLSSISFSSFDADMLIDASAFDHDDPRMSTMFDVEEGEDEEALYARIQNIQDEALRRQLLSASTASSTVSSLSSSFGPSIRFNRNGNALVNGLNNGTVLSEASTMSSNESFGSAPKDTGAVRESSHQHATKKAHNAAQAQVANALADQAELLLRIQREHQRGGDGRGMQLL